ncbi:MAG: response regulator transcription factor [Chloroflexi bacterium]|nr:response regulator transcription factor [Chloroflexota bacterium]
MTRKTSLSDTATKDRGSIEVLVVEDHTIVRDGVCMLLENEADIEVVGRVGSGEEAMEFLCHTKPDVVVMDLGLPGVSGIEVTRKLTKDSPDVRVLAWSVFSADEYLLGMIDAGASGYLMKQSMTNELVQAIRTVADGLMFLDPLATKTVMESLRKRGRRSSSHGPLTEQEKAILGLIRQGYTSKQIASRLSLSSKTIENYRARILRKLQVKNCSEAVSLALQQGIIEPLT